MIKKWKSSLSAQIFIGIMALVICPCIILAVTMKISYENYIMNELEKQLDTRLENSEIELFDFFRNMVIMPHQYSESDYFLESIESNQLNFVEKTRVFDSIENNDSILGIYDEVQVKTTFYSNENQLYINWELPLGAEFDFTEIDVIKQAEKACGVPQWVTGHPFSQLDNNEEYLCLYKTVLNRNMEEIGTLLLSISQSDMNQLLNRYLINEKDGIYLCSRGGEILAKNDELGLLDVSEGFLMNLFEEEKDGSIIEVYSSEYLLKKYELAQDWYIDGESLALYYCMDYNLLLHHFNDYTMKMTLMLAVSCILVSCVVIIFAAYIVKPIKRLSKKMVNYGESFEVSIEKPKKRSDEIGILQMSFYNMQVTLGQYFEEKQQAQKEKSQYEVQFLKSQLSPHFLFNTLGTIKWMVLGKQHEDIIEVINALGEILRYSMGKSVDEVKISEEINNIKSYVKIQKYRYGATCELDIVCDVDMYSVYMLRFILQPVVENALRYGIEDKSQVMDIRIRMTEQNGRLCITVEDSGCGMDEMTLQKLRDRIRVDSSSMAVKNDDSYRQQDMQRTKGIGLFNINRQIKIRYGDEYGICIDSEEHVGTTVKYYLPLKMVDDISER